MTEYRTILLRVSLRRSLFMPPHASKSTSGSRQGGLSMSKTRMRYFEQDDVLHLAISDEPEAGSVELGPNITAELNDKGELIGIEILEASHFMRDSIMESVQARVLLVPKFQPAWQVGDTRTLSS